MAEAWESLFDKAMYCLDSRREQAAPWMRWSLGGGTALTLQLGHRLSRDIDIFVNTLRAIDLFTPRSNEAIRALTTDFYEDMNYVKLWFGAQGEVDFIAGVPLTPTPCTEQVVRGGQINLETPEEIVVQKLMSRAATLKYQDLFDVSAVTCAFPGLLERSSHVFGGQLPVLKARVQHLAGLDLSEARAKINTLPGWGHLMGTETALVLDFLDRCTAVADDTPLCHAPMELQRRTVG